MNPGVFKHAVNGPGGGYLFLADSYFLAQKVTDPQWQAEI